MKVLVIYAHPNPESYTGSIKRLICTELEQQGHQVELLDLYQDNFNASMTLEERLVYMEKDNTATVKPYIRQLQEADAMILVYPTWWMGPPAILKGWLDRVWLPGIVAGFDQKGVVAKLTNIKKILVVTTQGSSWLQMNIIGNPPKFMLKACLRLCTKSKSIDWMALYSMDKKTEGERKGFLEKVRTRLRKF